LAEEFINPNWHVILVHYPLGLLVVGVLIELGAFLWPRSSIRTAAKWMILIGALSAVPAATSGIYAFVDAAKGASTEPDGTWSELAAASRWKSEHQWLFMKWHIWLTCCGAGLAILGAVAWLGGSDHFRRRMHLPILAALVLSLGLMAAGAWFSGEAVYRHGVAVAPPSTENLAQPGDQHDAPTALLNRFLPPLQVHLLFVGLGLSLSLAALGLTIRRWSRTPPGAEGQECPPVADSTVGPADEVHPARWWLLSAGAVLVVILAGLLHTEQGDWTLPTLVSVLTSAFDSESRSAMRPYQSRLLIHILLGSALLVLPLVLATLARFARRARWMTLLFAGLLLIATGLQMWVGVMLLYNM